MGDPMGGLGCYCPHSSHSASASSYSNPLSGPADDALALSTASCDVKSPTGAFSGSAKKPKEPLAVRELVMLKKVVERQSPPKLLGGCAPHERSAGCYGRYGGRLRAGCRRGLPCCAVILGAGSVGPRLVTPGGTMKAIKKESRLKMPTSKILENPESVKGWPWRPWVLRKNKNKTKQKIYIGMLGLGLGRNRCQGGSL